MENADNSFVVSLQVLGRQILGSLPVDKRLVQDTQRHTWQDVNELEISSRLADVYLTHQHIGVKCRGR